MLLNGSTDLIAVHKLTEVSKSEISLLKEGETDKKKEYCAVVWSEKEITGEELACLEGNYQRSQTCSKDSKLFECCIVAHWLQERGWFIPCTLKWWTGTGSSSTCVVRQAHTSRSLFSDFGRTRPSLGELLSDRAAVDILSLDVTDVQLEWPPNRPSAE